MITLSSTALAALALVSGGWLALGAWATLRGASRSNLAGAATVAAGRSQALVEASPAIPVTIFPDGAIESDARLARMLGLDFVPASLEDFVGTTGGLDADSGAALDQAVAQAMAGGAVELPLRPLGSSRILLARGGPAPGDWPAGTVLLWLFDMTARETRIAELDSEKAQLGRAVDILSVLIEAAPMPMWYRDPDLSLLLVNNAYVAAVEAEDAAAVVDNRIELVEERGGISAAQQAGAARQSGKAMSRNLPVTIAGERRMTRIVDVPVSSGGVAGFAIDVQESAQARTDLLRMFRAGRDVLDRLSAGVAQFSPQRLLNFANEPFMRLFGVDADAVAERPEFGMLLDDLRARRRLPEMRNYPEWKEEKRRWFTAGLAAEEEDWLLPDGRHLRVVAQPLPDGGLLAVFEDRTEQLQLASARDTLLRVRTATFDNLFEAIGVFAADGRLQLWNNRFREVWQFEEEDLAEHPRVDAMAPHLAKKLKTPGHANLVREFVRAATAERRQRSGRVSMADGRDYEFAAVPLPDGNALFTMLDITDSRKIEAALRDRNQALEDADRLKTAFVSNMSYELRTPLTSISGFAELLAKGYAGELPQNAKDYVAAITEAVVRLGALIDNVLDLTQSDTGTLMLAENDVALLPLCEAAAEAVRAAADAKGLTFASDLDPAVGNVAGDPQRLRQAIENVLENAIGYTDAGGQVSLKAEGDADEVRIVIADTGRGIPAAEQELVFDRFYRVAAKRDGEAAVGLGLPLARQFVEAHGGRIDLQSTVGRGTTITLHLPRGA